MLWPGTIIYTYIYIRPGISQHYQQKLTTQKKYPVRATRFRLNSTHISNLGYIIDSHSSSWSRTSRADRFLIFMSCMICMIYLMSLRRGRIICIIWDRLPGLGLYPADPAQHLITAGYILSDLYDLSDPSDLIHLIWSIWYIWSIWSDPYDLSDPSDLIYMIYLIHLIYLRCEKKWIIGT